MKWLRSSAVVIAEVTVPSIGVGYELGIAESEKIPTLILYRLDESDRRCSAMVTGNPFFTLINYTEIHEAKHAITSFLIDRGFTKC